MLYFRQILIMAVSLYIVRVVLKVLGEVDYEIYNVVAGVVAMFNFLSNFMMVLTGTGKYAYRREGEVNVVPVGCLKN